MPRSDYTEAYAALLGMKWNVEWGMYTKHGLTSYKNPQNFSLVFFWEENGEHTRIEVPEEFIVPRSAVKSRADRMAMDRLIAVFHKLALPLWDIPHPDK